MNTTQTPEASQVLLDLVNSRLHVAGSVLDELGDDADARDWLRAHGGSGSPAEIAGARQAREALVPFLRGATATDVLAPWISGMQKSAVLVDGRLEWQLDVPDHLAIGARAVEEWAALQSPSGSRIRPCANPDCQHFLIDNSKANSRKWHSMDSCGNRMKSRRHYARTKEPSA